MLSIIILLSISLLLTIFIKDTIKTKSYENDFFVLDFQDDDTIINFDKTIVDTGDAIVVYYSSQSIIIKMNMIFRIYCENSDITITCLDEFKYLNNGYYQNINEGTYNINISIKYEKEKIIDIQANVERVSSAYNKIEIHVLRYNALIPIDQWNHDKYDFIYYENFNHCVGKEEQELVYENLNYVWVINELNMISENDYIYFVIDNESIKVEFGKVLTETYKTFFKKDNETEYIISLKNFKHRIFLIYFDNGRIIFDTSF